MTALPLLGNPAGELVQAGAATFDRPDGNTLNVNQSSNRLIVDWDSFSIGGGQTVHFSQPTAQSIALNRVTGGDVSAIHGTLSANGQVWVVNPTGVLVGSSGRIEAAGFLASTLNVGNDAFMEGGDLQFSGSSSALIQNEGVIQALDGNLLLIAREVRNAGTGSLEATQGGVTLVGSTEYLLRADAANAIPVSLGRGEGQVINQGMIEAAQADLLAAGGNVYALAVQNTGTVRATGITQREGRVFLDAGGGTTSQEGEVTARRSNGDGGEIRLLGREVNVAANARVDADGASAGAGGRVVVRSAGATTVEGEITAQGGLVETSGKTIHVGGPDSLVSVGHEGTWLLNAENVSVGLSLADLAEAELLAGASVILQAKDNVNFQAGITVAATGNLKIAVDSDGDGAGSILMNGHQVNFTGGTGNVDFYYNPTSYAASSGDFVGAVTVGTGTFIPWMWVHDLAGLQAINNRVSGSYALSRSIDASASNQMNDIGEGFAGFLPIGHSAGIAFTGRFDGRGETISNLYINRPEETSVGLFGRTESGAKIKNVTLVDGTIQGGDRTGALVGSMQNSTLENVHAAVDVVGGLQTGGLAGWAFSSTIKNASSTGTVSGKTQEIGGLVGGAYNSTLERVYATGDVTGSTHPTYDEFNVGGLIGYMFNGTLDLAYARGQVNASGFDAVGGLVGYAHGATITRSFASGSASGYNGVGGLVGQMTDGSISHSYATGAPSASSGAAGGFVGWVQGNVTFHYAYATNGPSGHGFFGSNQASSTGYTKLFYSAAAGDLWDDSLPGLVQAELTPLDFSATNAEGYTDWDFTSTWVFSERHNRPLLRQGSFTVSGETIGLSNESLRVYLHGSTDFNAGPSQSNVFGQFSILEEGWGNAVVFFSSRVDNQALAAHVFRAAGGDTITADLKDYELRFADGARVSTAKSAALGSSTSALPYDLYSSSLAVQNSVTVRAGADFAIDLPFDVYGTLVLSGSTTQSSQLTAEYLLVLGSGEHRLDHPDNLIRNVAGKLTGAGSLRLRGKANSDIMPYGLKVGTVGGYSGLTSQSGDILLHAYSYFGTALRVNELIQSDSGNITLYGESEGQDSGDGIRLHSHIISDSGDIKVRGLSTGGTGLRINQSFNQEESFRSFEENPLPNNQPYIHSTNGSVSLHGVGGSALYNYDILFDSGYSRFSESSPHTIEAGGMLIIVGKEAGKMGVARNVSFKSGGAFMLGGLDSDLQTLSDGAYSFGSASEGSVSVHMEFGAADIATAFNLPFLSLAYTGVNAGQPVNLTRHDFTVENLVLRGGAQFDIYRGEGQAGANNFSVGSLAGDLTPSGGGLRLDVSNVLTLGTVDDVTGLSASGDVFISHLMGEIHLDAPVSSSGGDVTLVARQLVNHAGSTAVSAGEGKVWRIWIGDTESAPSSQDLGNQISISRPTDKSLIPATPTRRFRTKATPCSSPTHPRFGSS